MKWYRKAAEREDLLAWGLGVMYHYGWGVEKNSEEAENLFKKGFEKLKELEQKGNLVSWYKRRLGYCHFNGYGVSQDFKEAFEWYKKAAEEADIYAQCLLGPLYRCLVPDCDGMG